MLYENSITIWYSVTTIWVFEYPNSCYRIPNSYRLFMKQNVYQIYRKKLHIATKTMNQILFFLGVSNLTYGKNISDNEHQLIFSIHYSVFGIQILESE